RRVHHHDLHARAQPRRTPCAYYAAPARARVPRSLRSRRRISATPTLLSLCAHMEGVFPGQVLIVLKRRKLRKTIDGRRSCPRQLLGGVSFDIGRKRPWIIKHRYSNIDERIEPIRSSKKPTHAVVAKEVVKCSAQPTDNGFSLRNRKGIAWDRCAQSECASTPALTPRARASHRDNRRRSDFEANPSASTFTSQRRELAIHNLVPIVRRQGTPRCRPGLALHE